MNRLQLFALIGYSDGRNFWYELVTMRSGELSARRSIFSLERGRLMADKLADRYGVVDRSGLYCGSIIRVG